MVLFLAFSLQDQVEKYGAYVGVAAFFGLAVLSLLYFSQARELRRLRDWAGRAPERAQEIEARVTAQAEDALRSAPQAAGVAAATAGGARAASSVAGSGTATQVVEEAEEAAAAQSGNGTTHAAEIAESATNGVVSASSDPDSVVEVSPAGEAAQVAAEPEHPPLPEPEEAEEPAAEEEPEEPDAPAGEIPVAPAEPATTVAPVVAAGEGAAERVVEVGPEGEAAQSGEAPEETVAAEHEAEPPPVPRATPLPRREPAPAAPLRQPGRSATMPPRRPAAARLAEPAGDSHAVRNGLLAGLGLIVIVVGILFATGVLGGGDDGGKPSAGGQVTSGTSSSGGGNGSSTPSASNEPALTPKSTRIQVLNGTTIPGLASTASDKLRGAGYTGKLGTGDNTSQQVADSSVLYGSRRGARTQARTIARRLEISTVERMDSDTRALSENADVAVILGQDQAP
jgi:hypothetical protein